MSWGTRKNLFFSHLMKSFNKDISPLNISAWIECCSVANCVTRMLLMSEPFASKTFQVGFPKS